MGRSNLTQYTMVVEPAEDGKGAYYCAYFPDLPGCTTMALTLEELDVNAREAIELYLGALEQSGQPIPEPRHEIRSITVRSIAIKASSKKAQHVLPHKTGWVIAAEGSKRAGRVFSTQQQAISAGREIARNEGSELLIHAKSGRIRDRYVYTNDPFPAKESVSLKKSSRP